MIEWPLRARWVKFSEREPHRKQGAIARKIGYDSLHSIVVVGFSGGLTNIWEVSGGGIIFKENFQDWEWLELEDNTTLVSYNFQKAPKSAGVKLPMPNDFKEIE